MSRSLSWLTLAVTLLSCCLPPREDGADRQPVAAGETNCASWRLLVAEEGAIAAIEHPHGGLEHALPLSAAAMASGDDEGLFVAAGGALLVERHGDAEVVVDHPSRALAYDRPHDRLYVALEGGGVIALDDPAGSAPSVDFISFERPDALAVGVEGHLFAAVADPSGSSELLRFGFQGLEASARSDAWGPIRALAIGVDGSLYLVDGSDTVFVLDNPESLVGHVEPSKRVAVLAPEARLEAVLVAPDGIGYLADAQAGAIYAIPELSDAYPFAAPSLTLTGFEAPHALALLPPCPQ